MSLIETRRATHGDPWDTACHYCPEDPTAYPRDMMRAKLARIFSGGIHMEHVEDLYEYAKMLEGFKARIERQGHGA